MHYVAAAILVLLGGVVLSSCAESDLPGGENVKVGDSVAGDGDVTEGIVSCDAKLLLQKKCGTCHGVDAKLGDLDLHATGLDERLVGTPSLSCPDWILVVPGSPERSNLYQKVASDSPPCGERMPMNHPLMQSEIDCIAEYIRSLAGDSPVEACETCGGTTCIDLATDPTNCGGCNSPCGSAGICRDGACKACSEDTQSCDGTCVDLKTSSLHCGSCGQPCGGGQSCVAGVCECSVNAEGVSFAADLAPMFEQACATNGCHADSAGGNTTGKPSGSGPGDVTSDLVLTPTRAYASLVGMPSGCGDSAFVEPGDVSSSYLMNKLTGVEMCGGTKMPKGGAPFTQVQLDLVGSWICSGATNN
jgi:Stigma-specific protein, Stig1